MPLSAEQLVRMAEYQRHRAHQRSELLEERKHQAHEEIQRLVADFRTTDPGLSKVVLFGSLARNDVSSPDFDIDLAVSCSAASFLSLVAIALECPFPVDVVDLATADDRLKASILRDGVVLYAV
jgi:predicted nucleotidyltransferase